MTVDQATIPFFPTADDARPYISLVMQLGVQPNDVKRAPATPKVTRIAHDTRHPRYSICVNGCSRNVYAVMTEGKIYPSLLAEEALAHPRGRDPAHLSAVWRMKPVWVGGAAVCFDWIGDPELGEEVDVKVEEGIVVLVEDEGAVSE